MTNIRSFTKIILPLFLMIFLGLNLAIPSLSQENSNLSQENTSSFPPFKNYPLPETLKELPWETEDDYFNELDSHPAGALIWRSFPVKVYISQPDPDLSSSGLKAFTQWQEAAKKAIALWHPYMNMIQVDNQEEAEIMILRQPPKIKAEINRETGLYNLPRNPAATTRVQFYLTPDNPPQLKHKMAIEVSPHQTFEYLISNISHEMGHALGIWGHSNNEQDIMYYSHTREIPQISPRDINTLKKVYQQPTRLGSELTQN